jgi:hypothetical protein
VDHVKGKAPANETGASYTGNTEPGSAAILPLGKCPGEIDRTAGELGLKYDLVEGRMPVRTRDQIEVACLPLVRAALGCGDVIRVEIDRGHCAPPGERAAGPK